MVGSVSVRGIKNRSNSGLRFKSLICFKIFDKGRGGMAISLSLLFALSSLFELPKINN